MTGHENLRWRKASRSDNTGGNCVEVAKFAPGHAVRDSKNTSGPVLEFTTGRFTGFLAALRTGHFDHES